MTKLPKATHTPPTHDQLQAKKPALTLMPDAGADELLAPAHEPQLAAPETAPPSPRVSTSPTDATAGPADEVAYQRALSDGTIPAFTEQPDETAVEGSSAPIDVNAEQAAWASLIAFINQHKDEGTTATLADPNAFTQGLD